MLWRELVSWNAHRVMLTAIATVVCLAIGAVVAMACPAINGHVPPPFSVLLGRSRRLVR